MSSPEPTIAVVVPNFNYGRYLSQTLDSVLAQTEPFDEIVVVDDGSTDNSLEILAGYADRARIVSITNCGQLGACRAGLLTVRSDYVYFLDADDLATPGLVAGIRSSLMTGPAKLQFQLDGMDSEGGLQNSAFPTYPPNYDSASMRADNACAGFYICPPTSGNVYSREVLLRMDISRFDSRGVIDGSPTLALPYFGDIVSINAPLARYRRHGNSMSAWSNPSVSLLEKELSLFRKSWEEVKPVIGTAYPSEGLEGSLYVLERRLMIACLSGRIRTVGLAARFVRRLLQTNAPPRHKVMFAAWAAMLTFPAAGLRLYLIRMKRSSINRPRGMQTIINFVLGVRRVAT